MILAVCTKVVKEQYKGPLVEPDVGTDTVTKGSRQDSAGTMQKTPQYG